MKQGRISKRLFSLALSIIVLVCAGVTGAVSLKNWRPLRESGTSPSSKTPSQPQWNSDFTDFLICGIDNTKNLTDVIMIVGFNNKNKKISILQIPRDTYAGRNIPTHKYNAVYGHHKKGVSGMETLKAHIESDFGIKISNYAAVTTKGLRNLVDAAGGVDIDVPINMNYDDREQNLHIHLKKGRQHLDGVKAEQFVRYRKGWTQGDIGRLGAQKIFLAAFAQKLKSMGIVKIGSKILPAVSAPYFVTDLSAYDMLNLYGSAKEVSLSDAAVYTMPGEGYTGSGGKALYSVHKKALLKILNKGFVPSGVTLKLSDLGIVQKADTESQGGSGKSLNNILSSSQK